MEMEHKMRFILILRLHFFLFIVGRFIQGRVTDPQGKPVPGIVVTFRNYDIESGRQTDGGWTNVMTNRDGRYRFVGVAPGGHLVDLENHQVKSDIFEVLPGKTVTRDLVTRE